MNNKAITAIIIVLALILAGLIGLLVYLKAGSRAPEVTEPSGTQSAGESLETQADPATDPENPLNTQPPAFTFATEGEDAATPQVPVQGVDPMDPAGATEGPEVDPTLGADETVDPTENELPIVEG